MGVLWIVVYVVLAIVAVVVLFFLLLALLGLILKLTMRSRTVADEVYRAQTPDGWKLRLFRHKARSGDGEPVLLVPGLIANHWEFEEPRGQSMADYLSQRGFDCWILDPRGRRSSTAPSRKAQKTVSWEDHVDLDLPTAIDYIRVATGFDRVHYIGHSLGGMLLYAFDACYGQDKIASATTLGSPVSFRSISHKKFRTPLSFLRVRPVFSFFLRAFSPIARIIRRQWKFLPVNWRNMHPRVGARAFYNSLDVPSYHLAKELYDCAKSSRWCMKSGELDMDESLAELETPIFAIYGAADPLTPLSEAEAFFEALEQDDKRMLVLGKQNGHAEDYSHIDLVMGRYAREEVFEPILEWMVEHPIRERLDLESAASPPKAIQVVDEVVLEEEDEEPVREVVEDDAEAEVELLSVPEVRHVELHRELTLDEDDEAILQEDENVEVDVVEFPDLPVASEPEEHEEGVPVLPETSLERLAQLAREVRDDDGITEAGAEPESEPELVLSGRRRPTVKKWPGSTPKTAEKKAATKKPAAKKSTAKSAAKKPAAKKKPRAKTDE